MAWPLRALWVKFMVMSGVVKVTADCPTWQRLTALEYHFASTCLPTRQAWAFHSFPPLLLRLGTAIMFLVELVAPWFLLAPITAMRRVGVLIQLPLQILIQYTGNYNWFNLHTCILLLRHGRAIFMKTRTRGSAGGGVTGVDEHVTFRL